VGRVTAVVDVAGVTCVIACCLAFGAVVGVVVVEPMHGKTFNRDSRLGPDVRGAVCNAWPQYNME